MTDRPIIFSAPMVRALLDGRKTQTRRLAKFVQPDGDGWHIRGAGGGIVGADDDIVGTFGRDYAPYAVGDRLYVREAWRTGLAYEDLSPSMMGGEEPVLFECDGTTERWTRGSSEPGRIRASMHMPRWASRLTLFVQDMRVQRLQEISEADAIAEGVKLIGIEYGVPGVRETWNEKHCAVAAFRALWESLHGAGSWAANPWVVAVTFRVARGNIDEQPS